MSSADRFTRLAGGFEGIGQHNAAHALRQAADEIRRLEKRVDELEGSE